MNDLELLQLMTDSAKDAVLITKEEFDIELDYSVASVGKIDSVLTAYIDAYKEQALEDKAVFTLCNVYGAYIGEAFRKIAGGNWVLDENNPDAPSTFLKIGDNTYAFAGICYERLVNQSQTTVDEYFTAALSQHKSH